MLEWWNQLSLVSQVFLCVAVPATVIMILQTLLLVLGGGGDADGGLDLDSDGDLDLDLDLDTDLDGDLDPDMGMDADGDGDTGDGLALFTIRGIVAFLTVGGWVGFVANQGGLPLIGSVSLALVSGSAALVGVAWLMKKAMELQDSGNFNLQDALGKEGEAYLPIPPKGQGRGKVTLLLSSGYVELDAVNFGDAAIPTGAPVVVCDLADPTTVTVRALAAEKPEPDSRQTGITQI